MKIPKFQSIITQFPVIPYSNGCVVAVSNRPFDPLEYHEIIERVAISKYFEQVAIEESPRDAKIMRRMMRHIWNSTYGVTTRAFSDTIHERAEWKVNFTYGVDFRLVTTQKQNYAIVLSTDNSIPTEEPLTLMGALRRADCGIIAETKKRLITSGDLIGIKNAYHTMVAKSKSDFVKFLMDQKMTTFDRAYLGALYQASKGDIENNCTIPEATSIFDIHRKVINRV